MRGRVGTDIGIKLFTCNVDVSLHSKTHPLLMKYSNGTITQCYAYHYPSLFPVLFLQSLYICPFFSFTCPHSFFTCSKQIACLLYTPSTQYTNEMCALFCTSPNCSTDSSRQNVLTCNLALGQETVATRFIKKT